MLVSVPLISPVPLTAIPVTATVLSLVQLNAVPIVLLLLTIVVIDEPVQIVCDDGDATKGFTVAVTGVLGELVQTIPGVYSNSIRPMLVVEPNSLQTFCGTTLLSGYCIPSLSICTGVPLIMIVASPGAYELISPLYPKMPITSPALTGIFTGITPVDKLFCVKNTVVNALVDPEKTGGGTLPVNFRTAIL